MKRSIIIFLVILAACKPFHKEAGNTGNDTCLAEEVKKETLRAWKAYVKYAWGHDVLKPVSGGYHDWYDQPAFIQGIDAYSTLKVMGLDEEAKRIEQYVADSLDFDIDIFVKTFEFNIRNLGGLVCMYELTGNPKILARAEDFGQRLMPAFESGTGIPHYWVNLKTGEVKGDTVNVAEAGTFLIEMGVLSYYTQNPEYYQAAKKAIMQVYEHRSPIGLVSENINIESGAPVDSISHIGACIDSYYEYLYKAWLLFKDPDLKVIWDNSMPAVHKYIAEESENGLFYGKVNSFTGELIKPEITLWDAYFPALLALSGDTERAKKLQESWHWLWNKHSLEPMIYNYESDEIMNPRYYLNPEIIESAYYLFYFTGDSAYYEMGRKYYKDIKEYCRTGIAYAHIEDIRTKEQSDLMSTYFIAETMKYFYLLFSEECRVNPDDYVFSTEAHPYRKMSFSQDKIKTGLGI